MNYFLLNLNIKNVYTEIVERARVLCLKQFEWSIVSDENGPGLTCKLPHCVTKLTSCHLHPVAAMAPPCGKKHILYIKSPTTVTLAIIKTHQQL